jgi:hypothetical protein
MDPLKVHKCAKIKRTNKTGYKRKTPQVRLRFMFHYCIPPARQPTSPPNLPPEHRHPLEFSGALVAILADTALRRAVTHSARVAIAERGLAGGLCSYHSLLSYPAEAARVCHQRTDTRGKHSPPEPEDALVHTSGPPWPCLASGQASCSPGSLARSGAPSMRPLAKMRPFAKKC